MFFSFRKENILRFASIVVVVAFAFPIEFFVEAMPLSLFVEMKNSGFAFYIQKTLVLPVVCDFKNLNFVAAATIC